MSNAERLRMQENEFKVSGDKVFYTIQGEGSSIGEPSVFLRLHFCNLRCSWCFVGNTYVLVSSGKKKIKDVRVGEKVLASNGTDVVEREVQKVFNRIVNRNELLKLEFGDKNGLGRGEIYCTKDHKFYTTEGLKKASQLVFGDEIFYTNVNTWFMKNNNPRKFLSGEKWKMAIEKMKNRKFSKEHKRKISISKKKNPTKNFGEKNGNWRGGITISKYKNHNQQWEKIRKIILERDNSSCLMCGDDKDLVIHHIDFDNTNSVEENLCVLCRRCNSKINHGRFEFKPVLCNGKKVLKVSRIITRQAARFNGDSKKIKVYNLETKEYHNYFANGLLVHNCDTPYAVFPDRQDFQTESEDWTIKETVDKLEQSWTCTNPEKMKRLVITGGEPLIQKNRIDLLLDEIPDWKVEIETNGTIMPTEKQLQRCKFNCSPKLNNSDNPARKRINGEVIKTLAKVDSCFKFVITTPEDLDEIERDYIVPFSIPIDKVILMPEGRDSETLRKRSQSVVEYAKQKGYRLIGRLQIDIFGDKRAV